MAIKKHMPRRNRPGPCEEQLVVRPEMTLLVTLKDRFGCQRMVGSNRAAAWQKGNGSQTDPSQWEFQTKFRLKW